MKVGRTILTGTLVGLLMAGLGVACTGVFDMDTGSQNRGQGLGQGKLGSTPGSNANAPNVAADAGGVASGPDAGAAGGSGSPVIAACQNKSAGDACSVQKQGRTLFQGECADLRGRTICLPQEAADALADAGSTGRGGANGDAGVARRADAGQVSGAGVVSKLEGACQNKSTGDSCALNVDGQKVFDGTCESLGGRTLCTPDLKASGAAPTSADAGSGSNSSGSQSDDPVTGPCENKSSGDACTVEVAGRKIYEGTCNSFGVCVR